MLTGTALYALGAVIITASAVLAAMTPSCAPVSAAADAVVISAAYGARRARGRRRR